MAKKKAARKKVKSVARTKPAKAVRRQPKKLDPLLAAVKGAERREIGGVRLEVGRAGGARVKRMVYPAGFRWSVHMKPIVGTDLCMHAHVGFLAAAKSAFEHATVESSNTRPADRRHRAGAGWVGANPLIELTPRGDTVRWSVCPRPSSFVTDRLV
jgi:hypothetical protein